jgi:hypothetical protein
VNEFLDTSRPCPPRLETHRCVLRGQPDALVSLYLAHSRSLCSARDLKLPVEQLPARAGCASSFHPSAFFTGQRSLLSNPAPDLAALRRRRRCEAQAMSRGGGRSQAEWSVVRVGLPLPLAEPERTLASRGGLLASEARETRSRQPRESARSCSIRAVARAGARAALLPVLGSSVPRELQSDDCPEENL